MDTMVLHIDESPKHIAKAWFDKGKNEETLFKFISYWIVFNHLYNYGIDNFDDSDERFRIKSYCKRHLQVLESTIEFSKLDIYEFEKSPVLSGPKTIGEISQFKSKYDITEMIIDELYYTVANERNPIDKKIKIIELKEKAKAITDEYFDIRGDNNKRKIIALFSAMYTVRCNLFHGMKTPDPSRDYNLVEESASILEMCLKDLIEDTFKD